MGICHSFVEIPPFLKNPAVGVFKIDSEPPPLPHFEVDASAENANPQIHRDFADVPRPFFDLHSTLLQEAAVACEEEGPVAFIDTWYLSGDRAHVTEHSRTLHIDQHFEDWDRRIRYLWHDTIDGAHIPLSTSGSGQFLVTYQLDNVLATFL